MHFTLASLTMTDDEASRIRFKHPPPTPCLPLPVILSGLFAWPKTLAAQVDEGSVQNINAMLQGLHGLPGQSQVSVSREQLHLSIYRCRNSGTNLKKEIPKMKNEIRNKIGCGQVMGVEIAIKVVGCEYNESTSHGEYRVLASSRGGSAGGKEGGEDREARSKRAQTASVSSTSLLDSTIDLTDDDPLPPPLSLVATRHTPMSSTEGGRVCDDEEALCVDEIGTIRAMRLKRFA
jgi:hypothetical protein